MIFNLDTGKAYKLPTLNANHPANATVAVGGTVELKVVISENGYPAECAYQWYLDGKAASGATGSTYNFTPTAVGTTTIYCKVTNSAGTVTSRTATITATYNYLYNSGNQYTSVTGGWTVSGYTFRDWQVGATFNTDNINIALVSGQCMGGVGTENKVSFSGYTTLKASVTPAVAQLVYLYVMSQKGTMDTYAVASDVSSGTEKQTLTIDISGISNGYVAFGTNGSATIHSVWLE